ncbi:hypothetical protein BaRGS_00019272, partial [Batillaria attramentaria]
CTIPGSGGTALPPPGPPADLPMAGTTPIPPHPLWGTRGLPNPLLAHGLTPTTGDFGGAEWWRAASEHARRVARSTGVDFFAASLGGPAPSYANLGLESTPTGLEFLLAAPTEVDASALFGMSKHLSELPSTSTSSPSPSKRSRTPTPAPPAHQKTSTSKSSLTSSTSSSAAASKDPGYPPLSADAKGNWHVNGSAFSLKSLTSGERSSSRKHRHKARKAPASTVSSTVYSSPSTSAASASGSGVRKEADGDTALNLTKSSVTAAPSPPVTPGVQDLSMKKPSDQKKATNGTHHTDSDSPDVSSPGSEISDDSDNGNTSDMEKGEKSGERRPAHQIDGSKRQLLADQIRQQLMSGVPSTSPLATPLVIPSLRLRHGKDDQKTPSHNAHFSLLNLPHDYPHPEAFFSERDLLGLSSASSSHDASQHSAALSYLAGELRLNHQSKDDSQDSLHSFQQSEPEDSKMGTSGSERPMDSESQSGWGSEDDSSRRAGSSASPGPSYRGQGEGEDTSKRRNIVLNERELLIPLEHGWRRQTTIHGMGRRGIVGEVIYYAPCTKKMKTIPDVMRYLDRHGITDLSRENFTFNTKVNVGQFFEVRDNKVVPLTEVEILERIAMSKGKRARMQMLARKKCEKQLRQQALAKQVMEAKLKRRQEQQDMARKAAEMKFQMRLEKEQQREMAKKVREVRLVERQREKEHARIMKQQEKVRQQEQLRLEREMRAQQIIEARRRRQAELEEIRMKEIIRKNKEREMKKQQHLMEKEQERERRRQHLLLVKALEQRKKQEEKQEKERLREEKIREKNIERERRMAQRQVEMLIAREMKKPMDDMELRDGKPLPEFPRCPEAKLPGPAFSDCLMIVEFVHNFSDALGLDSDSLPTLEVLQNGLLNANEEDVEEMVTLYLHLLRFALDDLGVPNPKEAMTMLNQKITDLEINDATMSEVTRLFLSAHGEKKMSEWLEKIPLEALNPTKKAAIMAFLVNELLSSKRISGEIEKTLETINTLRRDKWVAEGKLRKLRTEDEGLSKEDMDKKIEKLVKQHNSYDSKVADVSKQLRGTCLGHDRYKRLYWILPSTGGIFVEGIESGETEENTDEQPPSSQKTEGVKTEETNSEKAEVKTEVKETDEGKVVKMEATENSSVKTEDKKLTSASDSVCVKEEKMEGLNGCASVSQTTGDVVSDKTQVNSADVPSTPSLPSQAAQLAQDTTDAEKMEKKDSAEDSVQRSSHSSLLFQEPILSKLTDLLKLPQTGAVGVQGSQTISSSSTSTTTAPAAASMTAAASLSVPTPVISTTTTPKVAQTISSTATTILSSTPVSALPLPVVTASEMKPSTPPPTSSHISPVSPATASSVATSSVNSPVSQASCIPRLFSTHLSPSVSQEACVAPELSTPVISKSDSTSPTTRKTLSFTSTTILSSTPLSMLSSAQESVTTAMLTPALMASPTSVTVSTPAVTSAVSSEQERQTVLASTPIASSTSSSLPSHVVSLLSSSPITSPIPSASSSPMKGDKKSNFISIDALLKKEPEADSPSVTSTATGTSPSPAKNHSATNNHFLPPNLFPPSPLVSEYFLKSYADILDQKPWFSILPRLPCDEASLSQASQKADGATSTHSRIAHLSQADSSVSIATNTSDVSSCMDSFKVPAPPSDSMFGDIFADLDPAAVLQKIQGEPLPIPISKQRGWWKINDMEQVRQMYNCLLSRGVREKNMAYSIRKYMELCSQVCTEDSGKTQMIKTEIKEETPESDPKPSDSDKQDDNSNSATADSDKTEVKVKQEKLEESEEETKKDEAMDVGTEDVDDAIPADPEESWNVRAGFEVEMACLEDVEALEDRIFNASLQVKAWKLPQRATEDPEIRMVDRSVVDPVAPECYPMDVARSRLLLLESNIERRYLKPPLMRNVQLNLVNIATAPEPRSSRSTCADTKSDKTADESREEEEDEMDTSHEEVIEQSEDVPPGLMLWRRAVHTAQTPAQLNLCTQLLGSSIAWEKSIMKVTCQICLKDDNEAELLLCDGCDKGYHTYCFKPKMETIPDGDWYCYECVTKASGVAHCIVCGQKGGKMVICERCPRAIHTDCLDPPLPRMPKKWQCASCITSKSKKSSKRKRKEAPPPAAAPSSSRERKDSVTSSCRDRKESESTDSDITICGKLLTELEKSNDGWPFLKPVSTKQFPSYKKIIAQPMDFHTMKAKLKDKTYKHRSEFAADVHLILNNCETFNEDDSEVGMAGHSLRKFFRQRWRELFSEDS